MDGPGERSALALRKLDWSFCLPTLQRARPLFTPSLSHMSWNTTLAVGCHQQYYPQEMWPTLSMSPMPWGPSRDRGIPKLPGRRCLLVLVVVVAGAMVACGGGEANLGGPAATPTPPSTLGGPAATPTPPSIPGGPAATPTPPPTGHAPRLAIDADPTDGGPCATIEDSRTVKRGAEFQIAVCLENADQMPVSGQLTTLTLLITYPDALIAPNRAGDGVFDLNANPDLNEGDALGGTDWDCNVLDAEVSAPRGTPSPASITCMTNDVRPNSLGASPVHIATVTFSAVSASHAATLAFASVDNPAGPSQVTSLLPSRVELLCGDNLECAGAQIVIEEGG